MNNEKKCEERDISRINKCERFPRSRESIDNMLTAMFLTKSSSGYAYRCTPSVSIF